MERRKEPRIKTDEPLRVTTLNSPGGTRGYATLLDISEGGLLMKYWGPLKVGDMLRLEARDMIMLGEVARVEPDGEACRAAVIISHTLHDLDALARSNETVLARA